MKTIMLLTTRYPKFAATYLSALGLLICFASYTWARPPSRTPVDVNIVAHQDDDILFINPDILNSVVAGHRQVTVFITSGSLNDECYARTREAGAIAGYQKLLELADTINHFHGFTGSFDRDSRYPASCVDTCFSCDPYTADLSTPGTASVDYQGPLHIGTRDLAVAKIADAPGGPRVMLIFLRVQTPCRVDGNSPDCSTVDLAQLFTSGDNNLQIGSDFPDQPGYTTPLYTKQQLINQLVDILNFVQPNKVRTQDPADGHIVDFRLSSTTTTIVSPQDLAQCTQSAPCTITVASTAEFPPSGVVDINVGGVHNIVTYTDKTSTALTGCYGGSSTTTTGNVVTLAYDGEQIPDLGCSGCDGGSNWYDHSDHVWGARFARQAIRRYDNLPNSQNQPSYFTYKAYNLEWNEAPETRLSTKYFCLKKSIFFNYALYDNGTRCGGEGASLCDTLLAQPDNFDCFSYLNIGYQKGQQQQSP